MKIYTRRGDAGDTGLFGGGRVPKSDDRVEAYGTVDELNAALGVAREAVEDGRLRERLGQIQSDLLRLGASLATPGKEDGSARPSAQEVPMERIPEMETWIDDAMEEISPLKNFILPGGNPLRSRSAPGPHGLPANGKSRRATSPRSGDGGGDRPVSESAVRPALHCRPSGESPGWRPGHDLVRRTGLIVLLASARRLQTTAVDSGAKPVAQDLDVILNLCMVP